MKSMKVSYTLLVDDDAAAVRSANGLGWRYIRGIAAEGTPMVYVPDDAEVSFETVLPEGYYVGGYDGYAWKHEGGLWYTYSEYGGARWNLYNGGADEGLFNGEDDYDPTTFTFLGPLIQETNNG